MQGCPQVPPGLLWAQNRPHNSAPLCPTDRGNSAPTPTPAKPSHIRALLPKGPYVWRHPQPQRAAGPGTASLVQMVGFLGVGTGSPA